MSRPGGPSGARLAETVALLGALVARPTVSSDPNLGLIEDCAERLEGLGARVRVSRDDGGAKANLFASFGPEGDGGLVLSGHTDVVPVEDQAWSSDPFRMREDAGRLYGRGTCDMKGFIAAVLATAPDWAGARLRRPLHIALTHDEEVGCIGARRLVETLRAEGLRPGAAIIGEPTSMRIVEAHKGCCEYATSFTGLEGHGSAPHLGVNAVEYAVRYAARLMALAEGLRARAPAGSPFDPPWTTLQIGRLAGGRAINVIPGRAEVEWEMRPVRAEDAAHVLAQIDAYAAADLLPAMRAVHPDAAIRRQVIGEVAGLEPARDNEARDIVAALTGANGAETAAFGTEAGLFQSLGASCVVCGPGSIAQAHKPDEYLEVTQLAACLAMLSGLGGGLIA